mgnify:CR=1 FL=1
MLNTIYQNLKLFFQETFPDIKLDEYRGEFKEKSPAGWNPQFPCCLIEMTEYSPVIRSLSNQIIKHRAEFTLYIAEKNSFGFELIQDIVEELDFKGVHVFADGVSHALDAYSVQVNSVKFLTGINSVRVHTLQISIS